MNSRILSAERRPSMPAVGSRRRLGRRPLCWMALLALLVTAAGCPAPDAEDQRPPDRTTAAEQETPEPPADLTDPLTQREEALAYARQLEFAEGDRHHWAWDQQHLDVVETDEQGNRQVVRGPLGTIWPEVNSHANSEEALERGRILARIELNAPYPKLGLPAGVSYLWVDTVPAVQQPRATRTAGQAEAQDTARFRAVIVPEDPEAEPSVRPVYYIAQDKPLPMALARWRWSPDDENAWFSCVSGGCCEVQRMR